MLLLARSGVRQAVRPEVTVAKAMLGLRAARRTNRIFHLWFHPSNFYYDTDTQFRILDRVLRAGAAARARGDIEIRTMKSFAASAASCAAIPAV
jgi:hypothetical protein